MTPLDIFRIQFLALPPKVKLLINSQNSICINDVVKKEDLIISIIGKRNHLLEDMDMPTYRDLIFGQMIETIDDVKHSDDIGTFGGVGFKYDITDYKEIIHFIYEADDDTDKEANLPRLYMFGVMKHYGHYMNMIYINKNKF